MVHSKDRNERQERGRGERKIQAERKRKWAMHQGPGGKVTSERENL